MAKSVQALLEDVRLLGEEQFKIVEAIRTLTKKTVRPLTEEVKSGGIVFSSGVQFGGVFAYKEHVSMELSYGAKIEDAQGILEGSGKGRRHIKLRSVGDVANKNVASFIALALAAAKGEA